MQMWTINVSYFFDDKTYSTYQYINDNNEGYKQIKRDGEVWAQ